MSVINCIASLVANKKINQEQADFARKIYRGIVDDGALKNMNAAQREGFAALKTAEAMAKDAANKKIELAQSTEIYNQLSDRVKAHPDSQKAGFAGLWDRDIRAAAGPNRENVTSLRDANYMPQLAAKMHAATDAYESKAGGLTQDTAGIRQMIGETFGVKTGNKIAETAAKGWNDMVDFGTKTAKDLGKIFDTDKDWRLPQFWTSSRVEKAGAVEIKSDLMKHVQSGALVVIDPVTKMRVTGDKMNRVMDEAIEHIRMDMSAKAGPSSLFKQETRVFRFTDGQKGVDAYLGMMDKYGPGQGGYFAMMQAHAQKMAQELATLHVFGPRSSAIADKLLQDSIEGDRAAALREGDRVKAGGAPTKTTIGQKIENTIAGWMENEGAISKLNDYMLGRLSHAGGETVAGFFSGLRSWIVSAKLGSAVITAVPGDAANWLMAAQFRGLDSGRLAADISEQLLTGKGDKEAIATRLGITAGAVSRVAIATKQYGDQLFGNNLSGVMQRVADFTIRASRLHAYDAAITRAFPMEFMATIGDNAGKSFADMDPNFRRFWSDYGFTEDEWNKIGNAGEKSFLTAGSSKFFMPDSLDGPLRAKLMSAIGDEKQFAYLAGGSSRVHAMTQSRDNSITAKLGQGFWMFKTFPMSILATHGMRAAQEGQAGKYAVAAQLGLFTTIAGAVSIQANQVLQGKDPRNMKDPQFWSAAALKGGALGVYGDVLKDVATNVGEIAQGPISGLLGSLGRFTTGAGKDLGNEVEGNAKPHANYGSAFADMLRQWTPGSNVWYAQAIFNRMIADNVQRQLDPSYSKSFERAQKRAQTNFGQKFWWAPGSNTPDRGPDVGAAMGP